MRFGDGLLLCVTMDCRRGEWLFDCVAVLAVTDLSKLLFGGLG